MYKVQKQADSSIVWDQDSGYPWGVKWLRRGHERGIWGAGGDLVLF